jgi:hypothetical protein
MPDTAVAPPPGPTSPPPPFSSPRRARSSPRDINWKKGAGEFLLIVVGVLVALSADALRQSIGERQRAAEYLADLRTDMRTMLQIVDKSVAFDSQAVVRAEAMVDYLQSTDRVPVDSVWGWRGFAWSGFVPVTGTLRALFETGDFRLLKPEIRRSLTAYATDQQYAERQIELSAIDVAQAAHLVREREEVYRRYTGPRSDTTASRATVDIERMRADPQLRAAYITGLVRLHVHLQRLRDFRVSVTGLQQVLDARH